MRLVLKSNDASEAHAFAQLLEAKGIPSEYLEHGLRNIGTHIPGGNEVWIYVNSQYDDAMSLLSDPDHEVVNKIDVEEFNHLYDSPQGKQDVQLIQQRFIKYVFILLGVVIAYVLIKASSLG